MFFKRNLCKKVLVCCLSINSFITSADKFDIESESEALLRSGVSGFSIAVVDKNGLIMSKGYGFPT